MDGVDNDDELILVMIDVGLAKLYVGEDMEIAKQVGCEHDSFVQRWSHIFLLNS